MEEVDSSGRQLAVNCLGEAGEVVKYAMKRQLKFAYQILNILYCITLSGNMRMRYTLYPEYNHKDAYILYDI